jgi:hypothetical protein
MQCRAALIISPLFVSCTLHIHVHEVSKPIGAASTGHAAAHATPPEPRMVRGVVRDSEGTGVEARVAVVGTAGGGSNTTTTEADGRFALPAVHSPDFALHASTEDGRVAIASSHPGEGAVELVLRRGAVFVIQLEGREKARCAVFADGVRIEDFTLRAGAREKVVVPPGELRVRIYEADTVLQERHFTATAGRTEEIRMQPDH